MTDQTPERHEPREGRVVSEMCRECGVLTGGTVAGNAVRWTLCDDCDRRSGEERRADGATYAGPDYEERTGTDRRAAPSSGETPREGCPSDPRETALWDALCLGLKRLPDFDPYDDEEHLVQAAYDAIVKASAPPAVEDGGEDADTLLHIADDIFRYSDSRDAGWASASIVALREIAARLRGSTEDDMGEMAEQFRKGWEAGHRAATEDEGRTVYYARCGWCGAYEGTVDPREACAQDPATGEFIGPHQFAVYEAALTPEPTEEEG